MVDGCAVGDRWCWGVGVCIDDFVAALFAFADYGGDTAEDAFAFVVCGARGGAVLCVVAVEDFGLGREARAGVWLRCKFVACLVGYGRSVERSEIIRLIGDEMR